MPAGGWEKGVRCGSSINAFVGRRKGKETEPAVGSEWENEQSILASSYGYNGSKRELGKEDG